MAAVKQKPLSELTTDQIWERYVIAKQVGTDREQDTLIEAFLASQERDRQREATEAAKEAADRTIAARNAATTEAAERKLRYQNAKRSAGAAAGRVKAAATIIANLTDVIGEAFEHLASTKRYSALPLQQRQAWETTLADAIHADLVRAGVPMMPNANALRTRDGGAEWAAKLTAAIEREGANINE